LAFQFFRPGLIILERWTLPLILDISLGQPYAHPAVVCGFYLQRSINTTAATDSATNAARMTQAQALEPPRIVSRDARITTYAPPLMAYRTLAGQ
jgi:hypothetical protein